MVLQVSLGGMLVALVMKCAVTYGTRFTMAHTHYSAMLTVVLHSPGTPTTWSRGSPPRSRSSSPRWSPDPNPHPHPNLNPNPDPDPNPNPHQEREAMEKEHAKEEKEAKKAEAVEKVNEQP